MDEIVEALELLGMPVEQLHAEAAHGQFEVVTTHDDPLQVKAMHTVLHPTRVVDRQTFRPDLRTFLIVEQHMCQPPRLTCQPEPLMIFLVYFALPAADVHTAIPHCRF